MSTLGIFVSRIFRAIAPDPFVIAVLLLMLSLVLGLTLGDFNQSTTPTLGAKIGLLADSFRDTGSGSHMWSLLSFAMQMCLVLLAGHVLASAPLVRLGISRLAALPKSGHAAAAMVGLVACLAGLINWGLGLIVGALLARDVGLSLKQRGIAHHYPIIAAAGYFGMMVWHGGLSGSAPLTMTSLEGAKRTLPGPIVEQLQGAGYAAGIPLDHTLFTPLNAASTLGLVVLIPVCLWLLTPRDSAEQVPMHDLPVKDQKSEKSGASDQTASELDSQESSQSGPIPAWLDRSLFINVFLALLLLAGLWRFLDAASLWRVGLNEVNTAILALGLVLHGSPKRFVAAVENAAGACGGIIVQFPLYAAIIAIMVQSGLIKLLADLASTASPQLLPVTTFLSAGVINLFVPSGGGQWAVQGPISLSAGFAKGVDPATLVMAVAYGDQLTNMLQPFWALPLLAITGVKARQIVGYTAIVMMVGAVYLSGVLWLMG